MFGTPQYHDRVWDRCNGGRKKEDLFRHISQRLSKSYTSRYRDK